MYRTQEIYLGPHYLQEISATNIVARMSLSVLSARPVKQLHYYKQSSGIKLKLQQSALTENL
jgi:hypothetical protein